MGRKKKVFEELEGYEYTNIPFEGDTINFMDLDETKMDTEHLFDDEDDDGYIEPYGWEN